MRKARVFISSVQKELAKERTALFQHFMNDTLLSTFFEPVLFENLPANHQTPNKVYIDELSQSQIYLGILGAEYGFEDAKGISPTEHEYNYARENDIIRWIFIKGDNEVERHPKEASFIRKVGDDVSRKRFETIEDLKQEVNKACVAYLQNKGLVTNVSFDAGLNSIATFDDIDEEKIQVFIRAARGKRGFPLREGTASAKILAHLNMLRDECITNSAILAFGKKPQQFFPTAIIKAAHFKGKVVEKPIPDHKILQGDVFEQVDQVVDFVLSKLTVSVGMRNESNQAPILYEIPRAAITEAIVNAVAHRDYTSNGSVQVMLFSDRLEITNPGRLPEELSLAKLKTQHSSYPANPFLAECMYQTGYIERFGTGTLEIIRLSEEAHLHLPEFKLDEGFKVVLWRPAAIEPKKDRKKTAQVTDYVTDQVSDQVTDQVGDQVDELICRTVRVLSKPQSRAELMAKLDLRHNTNFRDNYLNPALENGYIEMTLPDSPNSSKQQYRLTEKGQVLKKRLKNKR